MEYLVFGLFIFFILLLIFYVIQSIGLARIAKSIDKSTVLGWIPICNVYVIFKAGGANPNWLWYVLIIPILDTVAYLFPIVITMIIVVSCYIFLFAMTVYQYVLMYRIGKKYNVSVVLFILSIIIPFIGAIYYYIAGARAKEQMDAIN